MLKVMATQRFRYKAVRCYSQLLKCWRVVMFLFWTYLRLNWKLFCTFWKLFLIVDKLACTSIIALYTVLISMAWYGHNMACLKSSLIQNCYRCIAVAQIEWLLLSIMSSFCHPEFFDRHLPLFSYHHMYHWFD